MKKDTFFIFLFLILTVSLIFHPIILHFNTFLGARGSGEYMQYISIAFSLKNHLSFHLKHFFYPDGITPINIPFPITYIGLMIFFSNFSNNWVMINTLVIFLFAFLTALSIFYLNFLISKNCLKSILSSLIFFSASFFIPSFFSGHANLIQMFYIPFIFSFFEKYFQKKEKKYLFLVSIFFFLLIINSQEYFLLLSFLLPFYLFLKIKNVNDVFNLFFSFLSFCVLVLVAFPFFQPFIFSTNKPIRGRDETIKYSFEAYIASPYSLWFLFLYTISFFTFFLLPERKKRKILPYFFLSILSFFFSFSYPYFLLQKIIPLFTHFRTPYRFTLFTSLFVSLSLPNLLPKRSRTYKFFFIFILFLTECILLVKDYTILYDYSKAKKEFYRNLKTEGSIIEYPLIYYCAPNYNYIFHKMNVINGCASHYPPTYWHKFRKCGIYFPDFSKAECKNLFIENEVRIITFNKNLYPYDLEFLKNFKSLEFLGSCENIYAFRINFT